MSKRDFFGRPLEPGVNVDPVDVNAGLERQTALGINGAIFDSIDRHSRKGKPYPEKVQRGMRIAADIAANRAAETKGGLEWAAQLQQLHQVLGSH